MSKRVFAAESVPTQQQNLDSPDFTDDSIMPVNPYVMRGRMKNAHARGPWSVINLIDYKYDDDVMGSWTTGNNASKLFNQSSNMVTSTGTITFGDSPNAYIEYIKSVTINIEGADAVNIPTTGVDVWFRWMPLEAFNRYIYDSNNKVWDIYELYSGGMEIPSHAWQTQAWIPNEWVNIGTQYSKSFSVEIPMPVEWREWEEWVYLNGIASDSDYLQSGSQLRNYLKQDIDASFPEVLFQILISNHSTWKPNKYNYLWIGNADTFVEADFVNSTAWNNLKQEWNSTDSSLSDYKIGDKFVATWNNGDIWNGYATGYLPWNPYYGATSSVWHSKYRRQRTTFGDIAIFAPRRWRRFFYPEDWSH